MQKQKLGASIGRETAGAGVCMCVCARACACAGEGDSRLTQP